MSDSEVYTVGWICAIPAEFAAARTFLDEKHYPPKAVQQNDNNTYALGTMGLTTSSLLLCPRMNVIRSFPNFRIVLMVGSGGGAPSKQRDMQLGDVVVGSRDGWESGVIQYDYGKTIQNQALVEIGALTQPPPTLLNAVTGLETE
ncbi:uncharacterized protein PpBr36_11440 [Pyricularia pennisetigena]|uniref:uncharacterized protein n=1 Tax=Pyricularia pennisetigena TaxID=1578925 RepID=UPI0011544C98|nr:uncharacterized protein PpBr36_11440 [Pyricularia pennisetigena]TLS20303.1 hypothetical protein PpBr36_11440 [Pyricularia pennisetigena]